MLQRLALWLTLGLTLALVTGCVTRAPNPLPTPERAGRDGLTAEVPPDLLKVPDAVPRVEPIRPGGPNKPYEVLGERYEPLLEDRPYSEKGLASWYGKKFHGRPTASGETYNMFAMTAAHPRWPLPSYARVRNPANGREVIVRVNDRGPFSKGRVIDLSYTAALKLDVHRGVAPVEIQRLTFEEIRAGRWTREGTPPDPVLAAPATPVGAPDIASTQALREAAPVDDASPQVRAPSPGIWVQLGSFKGLDNALALKERVRQQWPEAEPLLTTFRDRGLHRVQLGPFDSAEQAQEAARRLRASSELQPLIVRR
jgi:rare lipoprotein A